MPRPKDFTPEMEERAAMVFASNIYGAVRRRGRHGDRELCDITEYLISVLGPRRLPEGLVNAFCGAVGGWVVITQLLDRDGWDAALLLLDQFQGYLNGIKDVDAVLREAARSKV